MSSVIAAVISALAMGQSILASHLLARRIVHSNVYLPLAVFFALNAVAQFCFIVREPVFYTDGITFLPQLTLFKLVVELMLPPLFWMYVRELTSEHARGWRSTDKYHFIIPVVPVAILAVLIGLASWNEAYGGSRGALILEILNTILNLAALIQFTVYIAFVMIRLASYRRKLMNLFASTEDLELRWFHWALWLILLNIALELGAEIANSVFHVPNPTYPWHGLARLALVWFFAVWGLRQRPDLRIEIARTQKEDSEETRKYQKSALSEEQLADVSQKIRFALEKQHKYRDPNLSLRALSEEIKVLPNYVTQALSLDIKETFFDYVNRLRVMEAMELLLNTDDTVLTIANDVGFNSRSSFYSAFKKVTGQTPTSFRQVSKSA